jgi:hypothetical protein
MIDYAQILSVNYVGLQWSLSNNDYNTLEWYSDTPKPTQAELNALWSSTQATLQTEQAQRQRAAAYVAEADPLFFKAQRGEATLAEWQSKIAEIKNRYPKP